MAVHRLVCLTSGSANVLADRPDVEAPREDSSLAAACIFDALPNTDAANVCIERRANAEHQALIAIS